MFLDGAAWFIDIYGVEMAQHGSEMHYFKSFL
jgi:hypothetical protein